MLSEEFAQKLVERFLLETGEVVQRVRPIEDAFIVESEEWWLVNEVESWANFQKSAGYELYEANRYITSRPPPRLHGIADLGNDDLFYLNRREDFRRFYARLAHQIVPQELAGLLARYQGENVSRETLVLDPNDLLSLLSQEQISALSALTGIETNSQGKLVSFCSSYIAPEPPLSIWKVGLNRWHVEEDAAGDLNWSVMSIARGLSSYLYEPKSN